MHWIGLICVVSSGFLIASTEAVTRTFEEIKYKCDKCACCKGGCDQATGICYNQTACLEGYWGRQGENLGDDEGDCRHECYDTNPPCISCGMHGGVWCSTCIDGYYVPPLRYTAPKCTLECNPGCQACVFSASACTSCKPGFYGPTSGCMNTCQPSCHSCNDNSSCTTCPVGNHGTLCQEDCPANCVSCTSATQCSACGPGYYGVYCQIACPSGCNLSGCDQISGACSSCKSGYHGAMCSMNCSVGCLNDVCIQNNGICAYGCRTSFSGDKCCVRAQNGHCKICETAYTCSVCDFGYFGANCNKPCSADCFNVTCDVSSGHCLVCERHRFGNFCELPCPSNCFDNHSHERICNRKSGKCELGCADRYHGDQCRSKCSQGCVDTICSQVDDHCNCIKGRIGDRCEEVEEKLVTDDEKLTAMYGVVGTMGASIVILVVIVVIMCILRYRNKPKINEATDMELNKATRHVSGQAMSDINTGDTFQPSYEILDGDKMDAGVYNTIDAMTDTNRV